MPPRYTVRAQLVDIRTDAPRVTDRFFVDTNVWAWAHYPGSHITPAGALLPQATEYPRYLGLVRISGAIRYRTALVFAELAHLIEVNESDGYSVVAGPLTLKEYRHNFPAERARVVSEIQRVWDRVEGDSDSLPLSLDDSLAKSASTRLASSAIDGHDLFSLEAMLASGVTQILSDDGDFCTVANIEVFTANPRVIAAARSQGRLVVRLRAKGPGTRIESRSAHAHHRPVSAHSLLAGGLHSGALS